MEHPEDQNRDQDQNRDRDQDRGRERSQDRDQDQDQDQDRDRDRERGQDRSQDRGRDQDRDRGRERSQDWSQDRGRERDRSQDKDRGQNLGPGQHRSRDEDPARPRLRAALAAAGVPWDQVTESHRLPGGTFNTVFRVTRSAGPPLVVKLAPGPGTPVLRYEHGILATEARYYEAAGALPTVSVPEVLPTRTVLGPATPGDPRAGAWDPDRNRTPSGDSNGPGNEPASGTVDGAASAGTADGAASAGNTPTAHLVLTECPGEPWHACGGRLGDAGRRTLREALGRQVAALHTLTGEAFGYPAEPFGPLHTAWRPAFLEMVDAVLADADRFAVRLPRPADEIRALFAAQSPVLDEVTVPTLVHFDLWDGNILIEPEAPAGPRITAVIDAERAFWGDPLADFVSLALFADIEKDDAFLTGYRAAGGKATFDPTARRRLSLYRAYLYLIMCVEATPRHYDTPRRTWLQNHVARPLSQTLTDWSHTPPTPPLH